MDVPSGCVVWVVITPDLSIDSFLWFGGEPGKPLPDVRSGKIAKHTKGDSLGKKGKRSAHREVRRTQFQPVKSIEELIGKLFGDLSPANAGLHYGNINDTI